MPFLGVTVLLNAVNWMGMIPAETLYLKGKKVMKHSPTWKQILQNPFFEPKHTLVSSTKAAGVEKEDIQALKKAGVKSIMVKESVPMIPIVLLGTIASLFVGDLIWILLQLA